MSLLSALLTQAQAVTPRKIDEAIQRQVLSGGDFETNLLEVDALGEDTLTAYCAAIMGVPPISRAEVVDASQAAAAKVPLELALRHQAVPVRIDKSVLVVATASALDANGRKALEAAAGMAVEARGVTSFRLAWALWRSYRQPLSPRFQRLAERVAGVAAGPMPPVTLPSARASAVPTPPLGEPRMRIAKSAFAALSAMLDDDDDDEAAPKKKSDPPAPQPDTPTPVVDVPVRIRPGTESGRRAPLTRPSQRPSSTSLPAAERATVPSGTTPRSVPPPATRPMPDAFTKITTTPISQRAPRAHAPIQDLAEAQRLLGAAKTREQVIDVTLAHLASVWRYAALCVVQGDSLDVLAARGAGLETADAKAVSFPLSALPAMAAVRANAAASVVRVEGSPENALAERFGRLGLREAAVAPVVLRGRVALLLWADRGGDAISSLVLRGLSLFAEDCAAALARLIVEKKRASHVPVALPRKGTIPPTMRTQRPAGPDREARAAALRSAVLAGVARRRPSSLGGTRPPVETRPSAAVRADGEAERLVGETARTGILGERTAATLLGMGDRALVVIFKHFPGPHTLNRAASLARVPSLDAAGPLLRLVLMFRQAAVPFLLDALESDDADRRYCALLCLHELAHPSALPRLSSFVLGDDEAMHPVALEVLRAHRRFGEFAVVGGTLRTALRDARSPAVVRRRSAMALGELRDVDAVPLLITALGDPDGPLAQAAQRALVLVSRQDFGSTSQHWLDWWSGSSGRHRVEWLIDALLHVDATVRHEASEELKKLTGQFFGYYYNLPRRERERAQQRYLEWWQREGAARFTGGVAPKEG